jgi:predicted nucleic acid-binding protein
LGREWQRLNLREYSSQHPIFIDANIFLDYTLPNTEFGRAVSDFLERVELQDIAAITTPAVLNEVSYILLLQRGMIILNTGNRDMVRSKIKTNRHFANLCYDAVDTFNEFISGLDGLKLIPVQPEDYLLASDLGRTYNLLPIDALHLSAMRRAQVRNIATRDRDFDRVDGIVVWSP